MLTGRGHDQHLTFIWPVLPALGDSDDINVSSSRHSVKNLSDGVSLYLLASGHFTIC
jgi:hypothetical protein